MKESFEDKRYGELYQELTAIVKRLESGTPELETALVDYKQGVSLLQELRRRLSEAEAEVKKMIEEEEAEEN